MSLIDKIVAAVTPAESDQERVTARLIARALADRSDWLSQILDHHDGIEAAFLQAKTSGSQAGRTQALKQLGLLLIGHEQAEEVVIYPALAELGGKGHAAMCYDEQATIKIELAFLEKLDPMAPEFHEQLEYVEELVAHHIYAEEHSWFPHLKAHLAPAEQARLTQRYAIEYSRYVGHQGSRMSASPL